MENQEVSTMDFKETELSLRLPGEKVQILEEKSVIKRRYSDTLDLNLGRDDSNCNKVARNGDYEQIKQSNAPKPPPPSK